MYDRYEARPPSLEVQVRTVFRERWSRTFVLTGDVEAVVRYEGFGSGERVYVDGRLCAQTSIWTWQIVYPFVEFSLPARGRDVPARIDVVGSFIPWRLGITRFRFAIDGSVLYEEVGREVWLRDESGIVTDEPYEEDY